jgi:hypothetical protein
LRSPSVISFFLMLGRPLKESTELLSMLDNPGRGHAEAAAKCPALLTMIGSGC